LLPISPQRTTASSVWRSAYTIPHRDPSGEVRVQAATSATPLELVKLEIAETRVA
jgi:hypothetical protein